MSEKQLNFIHIFDSETSASAENNNLVKEENNSLEIGNPEENNSLEIGNSEENNSLEIGNSEENNSLEIGNSEENNSLEIGNSEENNSEERDKEDASVEFFDPLEFNLQDEEARAEAERIFIEKELLAEEEFRFKRRQKLLNYGAPSATYFEDFLPEIEAYHQRMNSFKIEHDQAPAGEQKNKLYEILVAPQILDEEKYRDSARLYLNYLEAVKQESKEQISQFKFQKKNKKTANIVKKNKSGIKNSDGWKNGSGKDRSIEKFE
jgi:hypothetical protein